MLKGIAQPDVGKRHRRTDLRTQLTDILRQILSAQQIQPFLNGILMFEFEYFSVAAIGLFRFEKLVQVRSATRRRPSLS